MSDSTQQQADASKVALPGLILPSGSVSITKAAGELFTLIAKKHKLFWRGGVIVEPVEIDGVSSLDIVKPEAFRSRVEHYCQLFAWRIHKGVTVLKPTKMPRDDAAALMAAIEVRELLPAVAGIFRCPILVERGEGDVEVLTKGYHRDLGGLLIVDGHTLPEVGLEEAVAALERLIEEFDFQSEGDKSRALAAFLTPGLRMGGFLNGVATHVPIDVAEADKSQSGKGYRHNLVCAVYNESGYFITARNGGVGGTDESFASALVAGRPFICLDNFRGHLDSQHLESFLTSGNAFPARLPHRGEIMVNPKRFLLQLSSNGVAATIDLANRSSICRIRKREGFPYRDTLGEIQSQPGYHLACIYRIIREWIRRGKPRTADTRHAFRDWNQSLDWIVQNILKCAPLMDGHEAAQKRVSNPALSWLRSVAIAVERDGRLGVALTAAELTEVCQQHGLDIPGAKEVEPDRCNRQIGILMRRVFNDGAEASVEAYVVRRGDQEYEKPCGDRDKKPVYTFSKAVASTQPPNSTQPI